MIEQIKNWIDSLFNSSQHKLPETVVVAFYECNAFVESEEMDLRTAYKEASRWVRGGSKNPTLSIKKIDNIVVVERKYRHAVIHL